MLQGEEVLGNSSAVKQVVDTWKLQKEKCLKILKQ